MSTTLYLRTRYQTQRLWKLDVPHKRCAKYRTSSVTFVAKRSEVGRRFTVRDGRRNQSPDNSGVAWELRPSSDYLSASSWFLMESMCMCVCVCIKFHWKRETVRYALMRVIVSVGATYLVTGTNKTKWTYQNVEKHRCWDKAALYLSLKQLKHDGHSVDKPIPTIVTRYWRKNNVMSSMGNQGEI